MDPISRLLAEIKAQPAPKNQGETSPQAAPAIGSGGGNSPGLSGSTPQSLDALLDQLGEAQKRTVRATLSRSADPLLAEIKAYYQAQDRAAILASEKAQHEANRPCQPSNPEKQPPLAALPTQNRQALTQQAQVWLQTVSTETEEGLWFEEFASHYSSRLEAAIDYLEALQKATP